MTAVLPMVEPRYHTYPQWQSTLGDEVADLCDMIGYGPDDEQRLILDDVFALNAAGKSAAFEVCVVCARQNLKALATDTPLLTTRGWATMGTVQIGDEVYHPGGHTVRVVGVSEVKTGHTCYRVTTTDDRSVIADAGHLWTVVDKRTKRLQVRTLTTEDLLIEGLSRMTTGSRTSTFAGKAYTTNEYRWALPRQEPVKSPDVDLPIDPYLFGAWLGDGKSNSATLFSHADDAPHWAAEITRCGFVPTINPDRTCTAIGITTERGPKLHSRSFLGALRRLGVLGDKHVPDAYLAAGTSQREALLQGLMDTDGTVHHRSGQVTFTSTVQDLSNAVVFLVRSLGWRASVKEGTAWLNGQDCGPMWTVTFTPKTSDPFTPFRLARKAERVQDGEGRAGRFTISIKSIEPVPSVPVRCIKVDSPDGLFLAGRDLIPTHNTGSFKQCVLGWLFITDQRLVVWSAHEFSTAQEAFRDMAELIEGSDMLRKRVKRIYNGNGDERIELTTGQRILFKARTKTGGRGLSGDKVVLDEAFALQPTHLGALMPTLSVRPDPQLVYGSSAGMHTSVVLRGIRDRGRSGRSARLAYCEWCAPRDGCERDGCTHALGVEGCALDRVENWRSANPLLGKVRDNGTGLTVEYVQSEREALPPEEFARERLGWWDEPGAADAFGVGKWEACAGDLPPADLAITGLAVAVSYDLRFAAIAAAGLDADGVSHVAPLQHGPGTGWVAAAAKRLQDAHGVAEVAIDAGGPAADLIPALETEGVTFRKFGTPDVLDACAGIYKRVQERRLQHAEYPELQDAAGVAVQRPVGDRWAWGRKQSNADISTLEAATFASWLADTVKPKKRSIYEDRGLEVLG